MQSSAFWKAVLADRGNVLDSLLEFLRDSGTRYCLIDGAGINAYAYAVVTEDLDIVVAAEQIETLESALSRWFTVKRFPHSINNLRSGIEAPGQIQTDERYFGFVARSAEREVMDYRLPVARIEDLLQGKLWAAADGTRRPSKQLKDLSDIARILEVAPDLRSRVPQEILAKIPKQIE